MPDIGIGISASLLVSEASLGQLHTKACGTYLYVELVTVFAEVGVDDGHNSGETLHGEELHIAVHQGEDQLRGGGPVVGVLGQVGGQIRVERLNPEDLHPHVGGKEEHCLIGVLGKLWR